MLRDQFLKVQGRDTKAYDYRHIRIGYQRGAAIDNWRRIIATIIDGGNFCSDTINYISNPKTFDLFAILALLNSSPWEWRFRLTSTNNHVNAYEIDTMPLPPIDLAMPVNGRAERVEKAKRLYEKSLADGELQNALRFAEAQFEGSRTDFIHDLLAFLAERMIDMNQQKQKTTKQFLSDLKDFHGIEVRSMNPKTKLDEFWKLEAADLFAHFRANKERLRGSDEEKIRDRFSKAKSAILPLESQVAFTDRLIDQMVYRLYGLTLEEIKIVDSTLAKAST